MGKFEKKKTKSTTKVISFVVLLVLIPAALGLFRMLRGDSGAADASQEPETQTSQTETSQVPPLTEFPEAAGTQPASVPGETSVTAPSAIELPFLPENGKLEIMNLFQSDGINPDSDNQEGDNIATIAVKNNAEVMLIEATINAVLADGTEISFLAAHLPAGKTAIVFSRDNLPLADDAVCVSITCEAVWDETSQIMPEGVEASADGITVTIENHTAREIPELIIYCRSSLGEEYFGGIVYEYKINNLPPNESAAFQATDCITGLTEVIRIVKIDK